MRPLTLFISHSSELFTDNAPHGDGLIAYEFTTRLAERGHRLHVVAQQIDLRYPLHRNVVLHLITPRTSNPVLSRVEYALRCRRLLQRLTRTERIDIIHQMNPVYAGLSLGLIGFRIPLILGCYAARWPNDPDSLRAGGALVNGLIDFSRKCVVALQQRLAAAILLTTPAAKNQVPRFEEVAARVHYVPFGVDTETYSPEANWNQPDRFAAEQERPVILFLAGLSYRKGIFDLLEAFPAVVREFSSCRLLIVGRGPQLEEARQVASASPAASQIDFLPAQPRAATVPLYRACTVYCSPSLGEPFGMAVIEAMACGRPLVVTMAGGFLHTVPPEGGVHVPMADSAAISAALLKLLRNPDERLKMSDFNRRWVEERFSWPSVISKLESIYDQVLT